MTAATGRDTWNAGARPWKPCPDTEPHPRHEWFDGVKREDCPGVSAAKFGESNAGPGEASSIRQPDSPIQPSAASSEGMG